MELAVMEEFPAQKEGSRMAAYQSRHTVVGAMLR
jgi:hypothetical protein